MVVIDDKTKEFLEGVRRALEASRSEAGLPPAPSSPDLADLVAAVVNDLTAATISSTVSS